ncbi:MAG: restriction endonuclease [Proteobacteria bacterium]|nr:restriction endonuclease [Pseudomonadota bacterium]
MLNCIRCGGKVSFFDFIKKTSYKNICSNCQKAVDDGVKGYIQKLKSFILDNYVGINEKDLMNDFKKEFGLDGLDFRRTEYEIYEESFSGRIKELKAKEERKVFLEKVSSGDENSILDYLNDLRKNTSWAAAEGVKIEEYVKDIKAVRIRFNTRKVNIKNINDKEIAKLWLEYIYWDIWNIIRILFDNTEILKEWIEMFWIEGYTIFIDKYGHESDGCILSVEAERNEIGKINRDGFQKYILNNFTKVFNLIISEDKSIVSHYEQYKQRITEENVKKEETEEFKADELNIDNIDWFEFEILIKKLFEAMNFVVETTAKTSDGGIDLFAYNPESVFRGKYIIQCKKYSGNNKVGVRDVRDLYGVVTAERALKGIIVTTTNFTEEAKNFAEGKQIELIDGNYLKLLIQRYLKNQNE